MALTKLSAGTDQYWLLNDVPHQRGQFDVKATIGQKVVEIYATQTLKSLARGDFDEFSPDGITPYASTQALVNDLKTFFFRSVSGGGGGVQSLTGDGVGGTVTDPVLTFPTSNEVDNDSLIPGTTTSDALNNLGVSTSDNATDIGINATAIGTLQTNNTGLNTGDETTLSIQTKRPIKTVNLQSLEGVGDVTISGFDPVAEGVLTDYIDSQNQNTATSNATLPSLTTYLTLVGSGIDLSSDYRFNVSFAISHDATNSNAIVDIKDFGVSILSQVYTVEPKDNSNRTWISINGRITPNPLGGGQFQLQLDFGTDDNADDTTMYFANISLQKINE